MLMKTLATFLATLALLLAPIAHAKPQTQASEGATSPTIAVFRLTGEVSESPIDDSFPLFAPPTQSLKQITERMRKAAKDDNVKAVVLMSEGLMVGPGQIEELRAAIEDVKSAGKDVYAHSDSATMLNYVLLSGATR